MRFLENLYPGALLIPSPHPPRTHRFTWVPPPTNTLQMPRLAPLTYSLRCVCDCEPLEARGLVFMLSNCSSNKCEPSWPQKRF